MPCSGCGRSRDTSLAGTTLRGSKFAKDEAGLFPLHAHPGCTEGYHGAFQGASLFVAGLGTEHEKIFVRGHRVAAMRWAKEHKLTLDHVQARALCHDAVLAVLGT